MRDVSESAISSVFLPSLVKTISVEERSTWRIGLYLCADDTDQFYLSNAAKLRQLAGKVAPWLKLKLLFYPAVKNRVPNREAALQAYADGAEYLHRTNDDIMFATDGWLTTAVTALRALVPPNVGVVGPKVYGDGIRGQSTTLDVVHRSHLDIFQDYYPPQLDNWYVDDWIAFAYTRKAHQKRTFVLHHHKRFPTLSWTVLHKFTHGRRYAVASSQKPLLPALIECGRDAVEGWINHTTRSSTACASGATEVPPWPRVSCRAYPKLPVSDDAAEPSAPLRGSTHSRKLRNPPQQTACRPRRELVQPLEKAEFYRGVEGWCAHLLPVEGRPCHTK
jgi:hypothetical protein